MRGLDGSQMQQSASGVGDCMRSAVASPLTDVNSTAARHAKPGSALPPVCKRIVGDRESAIYGQTNGFQSLTMSWGIHVRR